MNAQGPFCFEISGAPVLRFTKYGVGARIMVCDSADDTTINAVPFWCDVHMAARLERAVEAFNRAFAEPVKESK